MGHNFATDLATDSHLTLEDAIRIHLSSNHYPPIPGTMVQPCIDAIDAYWEDDTARMIALPDGVSYKGNTEAPAWALIDAHHLNPWITEDDFESEEE